MYGGVAGGSEEGGRGGATITHLYQKSGCIHCHLLTRVQHCRLYRFQGLKV